VSRQAPADPNGAFIFRNGRFTPLGGIRGAATGHVNLNDRGQIVLLEPGNGLVAVAT
jgi:hypothetical protein